MTTSKTKLVAGLSVAGVLVIVVAAFVFAPGLFKSAEPVVIDPEIERQIKARQSAYQELGAAFKNIRDELKSAHPTKRMIDSSASQIRSYAKEPRNMFPEGSGPESGVETEAREAIWANMADFQQRFDTLIKETERLVEVANTQDHAALNRQVEVVGNVCKDCHDKYRDEKE